MAEERESLAGATAALDRAIDVLMRGQNAPTGYSASGGADRGGRGGVVQA